MLRELITVLLIAASSMQASALNRCTDKEGRVTYSDQPCVGNSESKRVSITDNSADSGDLRRRIEEEQRRNSPSSKIATLEEQQSGAIRIGPSNAERACLDATKSYEIEVSSISQDLRKMSNKFAAATQACGRELTMLERHQKLAALEDARSRRRSGGGTTVLIRQGPGYVTQTGEYCTAVPGGAVCPKSGFVKIVN